MSYDDSIRVLTVDHSTSTAHRLTHYDGVCNRMHGHNMSWDVKLFVDVPDTQDAMAIDFKDVSDVLDQYDHAVLLNEEDPMVEAFQASQEAAKTQVEELMGDVYWFDRDPTTEVLSNHVKKQLEEKPNVLEAQVTVYETEKYGMGTVSS